MKIVKLRRMQLENSSVRDKLDGLLKNKEEPLVSLISEKLTSGKQVIHGICASLKTPTNDYKPPDSIKLIHDYITTSDKIDRILYSEISSYIFSLDISDRGIFATNAEYLLYYSLNDGNQIDEDVRKIIIKIYDHSQLVLYQVENAKSIFSDSIKDAKDDLNKEIKGIEKEYISILGIFASIILAFVGGITFSSSVLQNMSGVSIYRLLLVIDFLTFALSNVIYLLVKFIVYINEKHIYPSKNRIKFIRIEILNTACAIIAVIILIAWLFNAQAIPDYVMKSLPWNR